MSGTEHDALPSARRVVAGLILIALLGVSAVAYVKRAEFTRYLWERHHFFPGVAAFVNRNDAELLLDVGSHYFTYDGDGRTPYDLEKAEQYTRNALREDPLVPTGWYQLGRLQFLRGHLASAITSFNRQIELYGGTFPKVYYIRGLTYGYAKLYDRAVDDFLTYFSYDDESWGTYNDIAWIYFQNGDYDIVASVAEAGLEKDPYNPWLLMARGVALFNLGDAEASRRELLRAQESARQLTFEDWIRAYPGNDPRVAEEGVAEIQRTIVKNLELAGD